MFYLPFPSHLRLQPHVSKEQIPPPSASLQTLTRPAKPQLQCPSFWTAFPPILLL